MGRGFIWTEQKRQAVDLWTEEWGISQREIAERLGISLHTLEGWLRRPAVRAEIEARYAAIRAKNEAYWARERAETQRKQREAEQRRASLLVTAHEDAKVWIAWRAACHQARAAHRKLPPEPPGIV